MVTGEVLHVDGGAHAGSGDHEQLAGGCHVIGSDVCR